MDFSEVGPVRPHKILNAAQEEELYGPEPLAVGKETLPEERKPKSTYAPETEIVYRMITSKETLFTQQDEGGKNGQGIRVWKPENHQHGTCIIGDMVSPDDEHFQLGDHHHLNLESISQNM